MKTLIITILLTMVATCGTVYSNPAMDALRNEMEGLRPLNEKSVDDLKRFNKLREILQSMERQSKNNEVIRQWEQEQKEEPCISMYRDECENGVRI